MGEGPGGGGENLLRKWKFRSSVLFIFIYPAYLQYKCDFCP